MVLAFALVSRSLLPSSGSSPSVVVLGAAVVDAVAAAGLAVAATATKGIGVDGPWFGVRRQPLNPKPSTPTVNNPTKPHKKPGPSRLRKPDLQHGVPQSGSQVNPSKTMPSLDACTQPTRADPVKLGLEQSAWPVDR